MMEHRLEIAKCAQARVSEEFYRLLRAGAAKRSMELLLETELLEILAPEMVHGLKGEPTARRRRCGARGSGATSPRSIDRPTLRPVPPSNALLLAVLVLPRLRDALDPDSNGVRDVGQLVAQTFMQALDRLRPSRRDSEIARQIMLDAAPHLARPRAAAGATEPALARVRRRGAAPGGDRLAGGGRRRQPGRTAGHRGGQRRR